MGQGDSMNRNLLLITTPLAIIIAGALIAAAIALTNRWEFYPTPQGGLDHRLDRWTGRVVVCGGAIRPGWEIPCPSSFEMPSAEDPRRRVR
jgi:hypothetical protein